MRHLLPVIAASLLLVHGGSSSRGQSSATAASARAALDAHHYAAAEAAYRKLVHEHPGSAELLTDLGIAQQLQGHASEAIQSFQAALRLQPLPRTYALLAEERCRTRDLEEARPMLKPILEQGDTKLIALVAPCYLDAGETVDSVVAYEALLADTAYPPDLALVQLARSYQEVASLFFRQLRTTDGSAPYLAAIQKARDSQTADAQPQDARSAFTIAAQTSPYFHAELTFPQAIEASRQHPHDAALLYLVVVLAGEQSIHSLELCSEKFPASPYLAQTMADVLADQGREDEAVAQYEQLMQQNPNLPELRDSLGLMYSKRQQWQKALQIFEQQLTADPADERAAARISEALLALERYDQLRHFLAQRVTAAHPPLWAMLDMATALQKLSDTRGSIAQLVAAEQQQPEVKSIHYRLMRLYAATGRTADADRENELFHKGAH